MTYHITSEQLVRLLQDACAAYEEYREQHGYVPAAARLAAIGEVLDGMTAERELVSDGIEMRRTHEVVSDE